MKKTVSTSFGIFAVALAGIGIWYAVTTRNSEATSEQFVSDAQKKKLVQIDFAVTAPKETPADQVLYLAGSAPNLGNWAADGLRLEKREDGKYHGSAEVMSGIEYLYKVTRGNWATVETDAKGEELNDHVLMVPDAQAVEVAVASWRDGGKTVPNRATIAGDVRPVSKFHSSNLGNDRTLVVYLPPDYDRNTETRYPVLYMQDGQNLFDAATSYAGIEWRADETAESLIAGKAIPPMIIVGIYNGLKQRSDEFTPPGLSEKGRGDLYGKFVVEEVKPFVDKTYRTQPDKAHTGLAGASQGGLISLHIAKQYPQVFGKLALLSPWLRLGEKKLIESDLKDASWAKDTKIWIDMGGKGGAQYPSADPGADGKELAALLAATKIDHSYTETPDLEHREPAFAADVGPMLMWLYGTGASTPSTQPAQ